MAPFPGVFCFLAILLSVEFVQVSEALKAGDSGVCVAKISVRKTKYKYVTINKWCGRKKCVQKKPVTYNVPEKRTVCCKGWEYDVSSDSCSAICSTGCFGGRCVSPEVCQCDPPAHLDPEHSNTCIQSCDPPCVNAECRNNTCFCNDNFNPYNTTHCAKCDSGYTIDKDLNCVPICASNCVNSNCTGPNICTCFDGYRNIDQFTCEPICDKACVNGKCTGPNLCTCFDGYRNSDEFTCEPICDKPCLNGKCTGPNTCACLDGYRNNDQFTCEPICDKACSNGKCTGPNICTCFDGYRNSEEFTCEPICDGACSNGKCTGPNTCTCFDGYQNPTNEFVCEPICDKACINGICTGPNTCTCLDGFRQADQFRCEPICEKDCVKAKCTGPNTCTCDDGHKNTDSYTCEPICEKPCVNGECTGPNSCTCVNGYKSISKFVCEPICDPMCMHNSNCTGANICTCLDGYTKINNSYCEPDCDSCNGECIGPNICICSEGYELLEGVCRPVCDSCTNGYCSSPGVCSCDGGYRKNDVGICVRDCQLPVTSSMGYNSTTMVRNYKRKTDKACYSKEQLREAVRAVESGRLSGYAATKTYGIPRMTIMDHVNNKRFKSKTLGRNTALSAEIEEKLASCLHLMEKYGFGLSRQEVLELVGDFVDRNDLSTPFKDGIPGEAWFLGFKQRHNLSVKKPQGVEYARKTAVDPFIIYPYFDLLEKTLDELNLRENPSAVWNVDETSFTKDPDRTKVVGRIGHAAKRVISTPGKSNTTVLLGCNAQGEKLPPLIVFKGKNMWDSWTSPEDYPSTTYAATKNGWMETEVFEAFFKKSFLPAIGDQRPVLLIFDGHSTHVGLNLIEEARKENVTLLKLPPHTTHILQPLDIAVMKSFKNNWDPLLVKWQRQNIGVALPKNEFSRLLGAVWAQINPQVLRNGFRKAGIFPVNRDEIEENYFDPMKLKQWTEFNNSQKIADLQADKTTNQLQNIIICPEKTNKILENKPESLVSLALKSVNNLFTGYDLGHEIHKAHLPEINGTVVVARSKETMAPMNKHSFSEPSTLCRAKPSSSGSEGFRYTNGNYQLSSKKIRLEPLISFNVNHSMPSTSFSNEPLCVSEIHNNKVRILENRVIGIEELILMKLRKGDNNKVKRRKIATGAEVLTHDDVLNRKIEETAKKIKKEKVAQKNQTKTKKKPPKKVQPKTGKSKVKTKKRRESTDESDMTSPVLDDDSEFENTELLEKIDASSDNDVNFQDKKIDMVRMIKKEKVAQKNQIERKKKPPQKVQTKTGNTKAKTKKKRESTDESDMSSPVLDDDSEYENMEHFMKDVVSVDDADQLMIQDDERETKIDYEEIFPNRKPVKVDDWLLVRFATKKTVKHYLGSVTEIKDGIPIVKYLRKSKKRDNGTVFIFPFVDDISELRSLEDIVSFLSKPRIERRGQVYFESYFEGFNLQ